MVILLAKSLTIDELNYILQISIAEFMDGEIELVEFFLNCILCHRMRPLCFIMKIKHTWKTQRLVDIVAARICC